MSNASTDKHLTAPMLAVLTSVQGAREGNQLLLDTKALEGLHLYAQNWPGPVCWMLSFEARPSSYSTRCRPEDLPFEVIEIAGDRSDVSTKLPGDAIVLAGADDFRDFDLSTTMPGRVVYVIEYTLKTRLDVLRTSVMSLPRKLRSALWELSTERKRKRAICSAIGLQCNGLPSHQLYGSLTSNTMQYFDTRLTVAMQIDEAGLLQKQNRVKENGPLRLAFSGRLERMKGTHYLLPLMRKLHVAGVDFIFEIFGGGALTKDLERAAQGDLAGKLILHGSVSFDDELVPALKAGIDLFICPHPQGDPSCTYMETLGCGVPILGFANEAWAAMAKHGEFGDVVAVGDVDGMARKIMKLDQNRHRLIEMMASAATFAQARPFEQVFLERVAHLKTCVEKNEAGHDRLL